MMKLLPKIWNIKVHQNGISFALKIPLMVALVKAGGRSNIHYWANNSKYVYFMGFSPYVLVRGGRRLIASFMSLKNGCAQIHSTTSEFGIVNWEATHIDEGFRKISHPR